MLMSDDQNETSTEVEFALLLPDGRLEFHHAAGNRGLTSTLRGHISGLGTQGLGRLRMWFSDDFGPDRRANPLANAVIEGLGYRHPTGWYGPVAVTMEEDSAGAVPTLTSNARDALEDLAATAAPSSS